MLTITTLTCSEAQRIIVRAIAESDNLGVTQNIAVVDTVGHLLAFARMDGANRMSIQIAINKAITAAATGVETETVAPRTLPGEPGYMIQNQCDGTFTTIGGGAPLRNGEMLVGAIGVSGGTVAQDLMISSRVKAWFEAETVGSRQ